MLPHRLDHLAPDRAGYGGLNMMNTEALIQARECAQFAASHLRAALAESSAVEALVLLPLIADAAKLADQISGLLAALRDWA
jgi:hypothetical protein